LAHFSQEISFFIRVQAVDWSFLHFTDTVGENRRIEVEELAQWLKSQHKGLRTYKTFQQRALEMGAQHRDQYALYYLLGMLVGRFVDSFEENPLTLDVTDEAHRRLVAFADKAAGYERMSADERLKLLNEIAGSELN